MPTYEYACTACGERTEAKQSFTDPPLELCPHCGGRLRKLYSPVGVVFKGSGFYSTDAKKKSSTSSSSPGDAKSSSSGDAAPSSEAKSTDGKASSSSGEKKSSSTSGEKSA